MLKPNQKICLYMNDGVPCGEYTSIKEAYEGLQECKRFDLSIDKLVAKFNEYYFEFHEEDDKNIYITDVKIYKRNNKYFMKSLKNN